MENTISKSSRGSYRCVCPVRVAPSHIMTQPAASPQVLLFCLNVFGLRFTVLRCRLISPRSMLPCAAARPTTTLRCMGTGVYRAAMTYSHYRINCVACYSMCIECSCLSLLKYSLSLMQRLLNPFECPYNGSRRQDCDCRNDYSAAGYTLFHKVRLDLNSLRIMSA